ncbi:MAG TPA: helix-hairpin-helix domain-containing protein, partial [Gemmatimonadaceae bacterium]|nr:helix-hairpin-helix domain-containing protein [Gemmatimonadaceae bacterium]
ALRTVQTLEDRQQKMATVTFGHRDVFGVKRGPEGAVVQVFQVRRGRVVERIELGTEAAVAASSDAEVVAAAIQQFYELRGAPPEVHASAEPDNRDALETWLSDRSGRRVKIAVPLRGEKRGLVDLANRNAALGYQNRFNQATAAQYDALETLRGVLALPSVPRRIECFDISTIQGSETVASMVVCEDGRMKRSEYRKFRIRGNVIAPAAGAPSESSSRGAPARDSLEPLRPAQAGRSSERGWGPASREKGGAPRALINDIHSPAALQQLAVAAPDARSPQPGSRFLNDFAAMHEVVLRRYRKVLENGGPFPDLVLIDGGKGQLSSAYAALQELGLGNLVAVGLAKKEELIFTRDREDAIALSADSPSLLLIQRIRDEAHRFAVTFHRLSRTKRDLRSELDAVGGIGPRRRKALLTAFGSLAGVRRATREELVKVVGAKSADAVLAHFAAQT